MPCSVDDKPSCIILAGGRGSRMQNADKGLLEVNGKKLIEYVLDNVADSVSDIIISANRNQDIYRQYSSSVVADLPEYAWQGPLGGIASCLPHCRQDKVLVTSCDIPVLPAGLVTTLSDALQNRDISICEVRRRLQPVFMLRSHCLASIRQALQDKRLGLLKWIQSQQHTVVTITSTGADFLNVNSPTQLQKLADSL